MAEPARVLVVANRTAATPALIEAVRERAARGPAAFTLLVPHVAHGLHKVVDAGDTDVSESATVLEPALPLLAEAAGGKDEVIVGAHGPLAATQDAVTLRACAEISRS